MTSGLPRSRSRFEKISIFPEGSGADGSSGSLRKSSKATAGLVTGTEYTPAFEASSSSSDGRPGNRVRR